MMVAKTTPVQCASVDYAGKPVRVVIVHDTFGTLTGYVAQGLERDIAAQGQSPEEALSRLKEIAVADAEMDHLHGTSLEPAPPHVHEWYRVAGDQAD